jgi:hypothetical protein
MSVVLQCLCLHRQLSGTAGQTAAHSCAVVGQSDRETLSLIPVDNLRLHVVLQRVWENIEVESRQFVKLCTTPGLAALN